MPDLVVLCYHAVSPAWPADLSVRPDAFRSQLVRLLARGYRGATISQALLEPRRAKTVCVTFDDAYASVLAEALPILRELGLPATVYAPSAFVGSDEPMSWPGIDQWLDTPYRSELTPLSWDDLATLLEHGWEVGSHTRTHPRLTQVADADLAGELTGSKDELEARLGAPCRSLAYPYGDHDPRVVTAADEAGYTTACTLPVRFAPPTSLTWPRVGLYHADGAVTFALKVSPIVRAVRSTAVWNALYEAARLVR